jgi:hypothetical protein
MFTPKISRSLFQRGVKVARRKFPFEKGDERGFELRTLNELLRNHLHFLDDYPSSKELSRSDGDPGVGYGFALVAGGPADLYSTLVQCVQNVQGVQIDSGFLPTI